MTLFSGVIMVPVVITNRTLSIEDLAVTIAVPIFVAYAFTRLLMILAGRDAREAESHAEDTVWRPPTWLLVFGVLIMAGVVVSLIADRRLRSVP